VTGRDDTLVTGKIALAHLKEFPDYYTATSPAWSSPCRERPLQLPSRTAISRSPHEIQRLTPMPGSARES